jgi:uncharacterized protein YkwD
MTLGRAVLLCALVAAAVPPAGQAAGAPEEQEMVDALNAVRGRHGLPALQTSASLERSSFFFAERLMRTDVFAHAKRIQASNRFRQLGEVLAWMSGWRLRRTLAVNMWLRSPPHRALILSRRFRYAGAGRSRGMLGGAPATIWVVQLGSR